MIDPASRNELLVRALREPGVAAVLFDVVIGHGAHSDPGGEIAQVLAGMGERKAVAVASLCGTEDDPQVYSAQVKKLVAAGVAVAPANALAAGMALRAARRGF